MSVFQTRIRQLRLEHEHTQKSLAAALGTAEGVIQQYELGKRKPGFDAIVAFARFFGCTTDYLYGLDDIPNRRATDEEAAMLAAV